VAVGKGKERTFGGRRMRPIKFRAWDKKFKKMYEGDIRIVLAFPNDDVEIMQFTGLLDKNGREIYEGDVVKFTSNTDCDYDGVVEFADGCFIIITDDIGWYFSDIHVEEWGLEVSGNIYEKR
jgi:uncharacterized phage protein (TIGR01671 family)